MRCRRYFETEKTEPVKAASVPIRPPVFYTNPVAYVQISYRVLRYGLIAAVIEADTDLVG